MVILDTDILVGVLRGHESAIVKIKELEEENINMFTTSITSYELLKGAYLSSNPQKNMLQVFKLLQNIDILNFDLEASDISAKIHSNLKKRGVITSVMDQMIAAIAISANKALITRNTKHYKNIPNLKINNW